MEADSLDIRLLRFRSRRDEPAMPLARALLDAGRSSEAIEVVHAGLAEAEHDPALLLLEGRAWFEQGDLAQAQAALLRAAKQSPRDKEPYRWLAQVLMKRGEPSRAVQVLERAMGLDPADRTLVQAHARAQRLARIAFDVESGSIATVDEPAEAVRPSAPEPVHVREVEPAPKPALRVPLPPPSIVPESVPHPAFSPLPSRVGKNVAPDVPKALSRPAPEGAPLAERANETKEPMVVESSASKTKEPIQGSASKSREPLAIGSSSQTAEPLTLSSPASKTAEPLVLSTPRANLSSPAAAPSTPVDTERDTVPPPADFKIDEDDAEDEATRAYELPAEIATMLESHREQASLAPKGPAREAAPPVRGRLDGGFALDEVEIDDDDESEHTVIAESLSLIPDAREAVREDSREVLLDNPTPQGDAKNAAASADPKDVSAIPFAETEAAPFPDAALPTEEPFTFEQKNPEEPDPPERVLDVLAAQGVFENGAQNVSVDEWVAKKDAPRAGQRLGRSLALGWGLALCAAGAGYYGYTRYLEMRRADARALIEQAVAETREGEATTLMAAERHLSEARKLDPKSATAVEALLFVHTTRALEAGGDVGYLRATIARAEQTTVFKPLIAAARAVVSAYDRDLDARQKYIDAALLGGNEDARVLYLVGRLLQRTGSADAEALLTKASEKDEAFGLAWLARAELARQSARTDEAREFFAKAMGKDGHHLRAELWLLLLDVTPENAPDLLRKLDGFQAEVDKAPATERVLASIARAAVLAASGDLDGSRAAVRQAAEIPNDDPEVLSLLADRAARVGEHDLAYRAANAAVARAPSNRRYRDALANVLLKRGDGQAVLAALAGLDDQSAWMMTMRARAALLSGTREALEEAKRTLSAHRASDVGREDYDAASLLLRVDLRLGANAESLLAAAKGVAEKAPESPLALIALGETYVLAGRGEQAVRVLERARLLGSEDADIYALLGRAYRLAGEPTKAVTAFKQGLELAPSHAEARQGYGGLLLDLGRYAEAESVFASLEKEHASTSASLGIIEALIGRGEVAAAKERLQAFSEEKRALPAVIAMAARVAIADRRAGEAVKLMEPLVAEESELRTAEMLTLYGDALYADNLVDSAAGAYEAALELDPEHPNALIGRAMAAVRAEKIDQAFELLVNAEKALETRVRPDAIRALVAITRAKAYLLKHDFARAKELLAPVIAVSGIPADTFFWYAETLAKTKTAGAAEQYTKYLELEPQGEFAARAKKALAPR